MRENILKFARNFTKGWKLWLIMGTIYFINSIIVDDLKAIRIMISLFICLYAINFFQEQ